MKELNKAKQEWKSQKYLTFKANKKQEDWDLKDWMKDILKKQ